MTTTTTKGRKGWHVKKCWWKCWRVILILNRGCNSCLQRMSDPLLSLFPPPPPTPTPPPSSLSDLWLICMVYLLTAGCELCHVNRILPEPEKNSFWVCLFVCLFVFLVVAVAFVCLLLLLFVFCFCLFVVVVVVVFGGVQASAIMGTWAVMY